MVSPGAGLEESPHCHVLKSFIIFFPFFQCPPPYLWHGDSLIEAQA